MPTATAALHKDQLKKLKAAMELMQMQEMAEGTQV
jgi:hypothetical protein